VETDFPYSFAKFGILMRVQQKRGAVSVIRMVIAPRHPHIDFGTPKAHLSNYLYDIFTFGVIT